MKGTVIHHLNVRIGKPSVNAPSFGFLDPGNIIEIDGKLYEGDRFEGINTWLKDAAENFYWSGAVNTPALTPPPVSIPSAVFVNYKDWIVRDNPALKKFPAAGGKKISIAVLDSGVWEDHPDFKGSFDQQNFPSVNCSDTSAVFDVKGHGSHVAGLIGARNTDAVGVTGVSPNVTIRNVKVLDDSGDSTATGLLKGLEEIEKIPVDILNLSLSIPFERLAMVKDILERISHNTIIVAAAGNNDTLLRESILAPASLPFVISVGAVDKAFIDQHATPRFNARLEYIIPEFMLTSCSTKEKLFYADDMGSSMATALVSGMVAFIMDRSKARSLQDVRQQLNDIAKPYAQNINPQSLTLIKQK